ncbi:MATE family efflux transporter [Methanosarcinaceae archaeon]|nr:MATE family efflux transporter [Methanosarcinaceae archaeon]
MNDERRILEGDIRKLYLRFLFPSLVSMCAYSAYIIDAAFIGNGIGREAFAAYNLVLPLFMVFTSLSTLLGIGGATAAAVCIGRGEYEKVNRIFTYSLCGAVFLGAVTFICGLFFPDPIARLLGAGESNIGYVKDYMRFILLFGLFFIGSYMLTHFMRNDNAPRQAMNFVILSAAVNMVLDYIFIYRFGWEMTGAGVSTAISVITGTVVFLLPHFRKGRTTLRPDPGCPVDAELIRRMLSNGFPPAVIEISSGITLFVFNMVLLREAGTNAVAAYGVIANVMLVCLSVMNGIAQAMQPVTSVNYGAGRKDRVREILKLGLISAVIGGILLIAFMNAYPELLASVFVSDPSELAGYIELAVPGIRIASVGVIFMGINLIIGGFLQSVEKYRTASLITMFRGFLIVIPCMLILTYLFGITGCWSSLPVAEFLTFLFTLAAFRIILKRERIFGRSGRERIRKKDIGFRARSRKTAGTGRQRTPEYGQDDPDKMDCFL